MIRDRISTPKSSAGRWKSIEQFTDKLVGVISPKWAAERSEWRAVKATTGALTSENTSLTTFMGQEQHPDNDTIPDSGKQRRRCVLAYLNNALVQGVVNSEIRQVLGTLDIQADTPDKKLNALIDAEWKAMLDAGIHDNIEMAMRHVLIDGGMVPHILSKPRERVRFEVIPYRRIKTPYGVINTAPTPPGEPQKGNLLPMPSPYVVRDGFKFNRQGIGLANDDLVSCYVTNEDSTYDSVYWDGAYTEIDVISHPVLPRLSGQTKGLSWYSAAITRLEMVNRWMTALLASAELHSTIVGIVMTPNKDARPLAASNTVLDPTTTKNLSKFAREHRFLFLPGNAEAKLIQANAPVIGEFLIWNLRFIARALGVSYERLTYDLTKTSFASTKFGDRDDLMTVKNHQKLALSQILKPLHRLVVGSLFMRPGLSIASAGKFAADPDAFMKFHCHFPGRPPVDELKAEEANKIALQNRTACRTDICAAGGKDAAHVQEMQIKEDTASLTARKKMWTAFGYPEDVARDLARDEMFAERSKTGALTTAAAQQDQQDEGSGKDSKGSQHDDANKEAA